MVIGPSSSPAGFALNHGRYFDDRIVEPQLPLFAQLHDGDGGEQLAVRRHAELRRRRHRRLLRDIREAKARRPHELLVAHDADGDSGQASIGDLPSIHAEKSRSAPRTSGSVATRDLLDGAAVACAWSERGVTMLAASAAPMSILASFGDVRRSNEDGSW